MFDPPSLEFIKCRYDPTLAEVVSESPTAVMRYVGAPRGGGRQFLLSFEGKEVGFQTATCFRDQVIERNEDGALVWHIGVIGCPIWRRERGQFRELTNLHVFDSKEQKRFLMELFRALMCVFDPDEERPIEDAVRSIVVFSSDPNG